eukprot:XP_011678233.1 PREDICTED: uncharacterized protein LOC105444975 [Strongylocentrotus purpuratus]
MENKTFKFMEDAVIVRTPAKKGLPSDAEKHWHPSIHIPRHHLVGLEQQRVFKRLYEGSKQMLGCPWSNEAKTSTTQCCRCRLDNKTHHEHRLQAATRPFCDHRIDACLPARQAVRLPYQPDALMQTIQKDADKNSKIQAPLSTVIVMWHVKKRDPGYSLETIYSELVKFGDVTDIVRTCEVSARATFCHLANACDAVSRKYIGRDANPLMILWYHRTMKNKTFHLWNRHLHVHVDPFT